MTSVPSPPEGAVDSAGMFAATAALPEQLAEAARAARGVGPLPRAEDLDVVVVAGMGGSGIAGEVLSAIASPRMAVPVVTCPSYELPAFCGPRSLVFAVSFSGGTEETLAVAERALSRGAPLLAVTTGGALGSLAKDAGVPCYPIAPGIPWPRAGIGATSAPLLVACEEIGLLEGISADIAAAVEQLARRRDTLVAAAGGLAVELARRIARTIPVVYGASGIGAVAARRWKTQVNENAKAPAFFAAQPELCHNEVCGWGEHGDMTRQVISLVNLRSDHESAGIGRRFSVVDELVREAVSEIVEVRAEGRGALAQLFDLVLLGDFVSLHLAFAEGVDPGPVPVLVEIKERLAAER